MADGLHVGQMLEWHRGSEEEGHREGGAKNAYRVDV